MVIKLPESRVVFASEPSRSFAAALNCPKNATCSTRKLRGFISVELLAKFGRKFERIVQANRKQEPLPAGDY